MNLAQLCAVLKSTALPVTERAWPAGKAPELPWIAYQVVDSSNFYADGIVYFPAMNVEVALYLRTLETSTIEPLETSFSQAGIVWEKDVEYDADEAVWQVLYQIQI